MATTTTNFGWDIPQSTDLVKDGATAIATLGQDIDTSMVDLKGGTSGQILSKASNTDMDFTWVAPTTGDITGVSAGTGISGGGTSGDVTITNSMATTIDAKGDLIVGTGSDAFARLAIGTDGQVLTADAASSGGMKWAAAGSTQSLDLLGSASLTGATTITVSGFSAKNNLMIFIDGASSANASSVFTMRFNSDSGSNYYFANYYMGDNSSINKSNSWPTTSYRVSVMSQYATSTLRSVIYVNSAAGTGRKYINNVSNINDTGTTLESIWGACNYIGSSAITSVSLISSSGNFDAGTLYVYGG